MPTPELTPAYVQAELAPDSLRLPSFPPLWPAGHAGPAVACEMGAIVIDGVVAGLRTQADCPPELVVAAADAARGTEWPALNHEGIEFSLAGYTWTQVFAPGGVAPREVLAYGWRPGALPPHRSEAPTSTTRLATTIPFRAVVTVGTDGVPRGVAVDTTPSSTSGAKLPDKVDGTEAATFLPARGQSGDTVYRLPMQVDDPARELLAWRWPVAPSPYRVVVQRNGSAFADPPESEAEPASAGPLALPSATQVRVVYERLRAEIVVPAEGPITLFRPEAIDATSPQWVIRADKDASFGRVVEAIDALVPEGQDGTVSFAVAERDDTVVTAHTWSVGVTRGTVPLPSPAIKHVYFRPADEESWASVVATADRLKETGFRPVLTPDTSPTPAPLQDGVTSTAPVATAAEKTVHWSEVQVKTRVVPKWPAGAPKEGEVRCIVRVHADERGVPTSVERKNCPDPFFAAARDAAMQWRFYPMRPAPGPIMFDINLIFKAS